MGNNESFLWEYQGNQFRLEQKSWYSSNNGWKISGIVTAKERLVLPSTYKGNPISCWQMDSGEKPLPAVRFLSIPDSITEISIQGRPFPNLERVEVQAGNPKFSTDGQMLYSVDGKILIYSLAMGNQERVVVPATVKKIADRAFRHSVCKEIVFENPDVSVEDNAFEMSVWLEQKGDYCIVGNMFFRLKRSMDLLVVPEYIKRFHERAFVQAIPKCMIAPISPSRSNVSNLEGKFYRDVKSLEELTITHFSATLNFANLARLTGLQNVHLSENHKKYCSVDGVIFTKDKKMLVFYPCGRQNKKYQIPEGTVKIARRAFAEQQYLEEVFMPDTVTTLGMSAFFHCKKLRKVRFSDAIKEIPDSSAYQNGGVFQQCKMLREITLPSKLQYLGSFAFYQSSLQKVEFHDKLRQIGEYAFAKCDLQDISLPATVERLGKGSLAGIETIDTYVGTAKGLVSAVNTVPPDMTEKRMNVEWGRCIVHARHKKGDKIETFLIPGSLKRTAAYHLDLAWNNDQIDYEEYDACFEEIMDSEERLEFAELGILRLQGEEDTPYVAYMKHTALRIASHLLEAKKEKEFLVFLDRGYLSDSSIGKLLKIANENGLTTCSAYLLKYQNAKGGRKAKRFSL